MARVTKRNRNSRPGPGSILGQYPQWSGPPAGTFDPGLEAQVRSSQRGLLDLIESSHRERERQGVDVGQKRREIRRGLVQGQGDIGRARGYAQADAAYQQGQLGTSYERDLQDLATAKQRGEEAYTRTLTDLQHRYATAAAGQQAASIRQGTDEGGSNSASALVRGANQQHDTSEVNRQHQEALEDLARREGRVQQDYGTDTSHLNEMLQRHLAGFNTQGQRLHQDTRTALHGLSLAAQRASTDRSVKLSHARREQGIYSTDVSQQAYYQAHQLNPNIIFPVPAAAGGPAHEPHAHAPSIPRPPRSGGLTYPGRRRRPAY